MRYYAIPDTHGYFELMHNAVKACKADAEYDGVEYKIITLGDYIDRGPRSRHIITFLVNSPEIIALMGNHEQILLKTKWEKLDPEWWLSNGGRTTLESYGHTKQTDRYDQNVDLSIIPEDHYKWLLNLPMWYETEKQLFVHAGAVTDDPLKEQSADTLLWMLYKDTDEGGWNGKFVVHGHHIHEDGPVLKKMRVGLDVGSFVNGKLCVGVFDDTQGAPIDFIDIQTDIKA